MLKNGLNASRLQLIAAAAMLLDHAAVLVNPAVMTVPWALLILFMEVVGRITIPIMCFFVSEGYYHTHDRKRYLMRMGVFAVISQLPFWFRCTAAMPDSFRNFVVENVMSLNVIFSLFMGLLALCIAKDERIHIVLRMLLCALCVGLTRCSDWRLFAVLWVLAFGLNRGSRAKQMLWFTVLLAFRAIIQFDGSVFHVILNMAGIAAVPLLLLYNGERGKKPKYGFYIFYPAHLIVIGIIRLIEGV